MIMSIEQKVLFPSYSYHGISPDPETDNCTNIKLCVGGFPGGGRGS